MKKIFLESDKDAQFNVGSRLDDLLLEIDGFMPSRGSYPFTMIRLGDSQVTNLKTNPTLTSDFQLLVLTRTDFSKNDLADYVTKSKEYTLIRSEDQAAFLKSYLGKYGHVAAEKLWREQITSLAIGIVTQLAKQQGLKLIPVEADLVKVDAQLNLDSRNLAAYKLFDVQYSE